MSPTVRRMVAPESDSALGMTWARCAAVTSPSSPPKGRVGDRLGAAGAPLPLTLGVHLATGSGRTRGAAPLRTAVVVGATGIVALTAAFTFTASLDHLDRDPADPGDSGLVALQKSRTAARVAGQVRPDQPA